MIDFNKVKITIKIENRKNFYKERGNKDVSIHI